MNCLQPHLLTPFLIFISYFEKSVHDRITCNNGYLLKVLPKVKLEFSKHGFYFQGVKLFNSLPIKIRQIEDFKEFMKEMKSYSF